MMFWLMHLYVEWDIFLKNKQKMLTSQIFFFSFDSKLVGTFILVILLLRKALQVWGQKREGEMDRLCQGLCCIISIRYAPMHKCTDPCTAQLSRQPQPQFNPSWIIRNWTTWYCCCCINTCKHNLQMIMIYDLG